PRSLQDNRGGDIFAKQGMRYRECGRVLNVGMAAKHLVDLQRSYLFASAVDHFLQAPRKKQISVAVEISLIPGSIPFAEKRIHVFIRIHFIAAEHAGAPHRDFSVLAGGERLTQLVDAPRLQADADARGSSFSYGRRGRVDRNASTFCRSIGVAQSSSKCALKGCSIVLIERRPASEQCMKTEIGCAPVDLKGQ